MSLINSKPILVPPAICDFGWYYGLSPQRLAELVYSIGSSTYPPGRSVLASTATLSTVTPFTISVASADSFEASGTVVINNGSNPQTVTYAAKGSTTLTGCLGGTGTFATGVPIYDPRFYIDSMPLNQPITFDAVDSNNFGLPVVVPAPSAPIVSYRWDFGNGSIGYGPTSTTFYSYSSPPPSIQATLTVVDALGRQFSCAHRLNLQDLAVEFGTSVRVSQGASR